ncbi:MAG: DEAD/DEAH box helicase [archaeon]
MQGSFSLLDKRIQNALRERGFSATPIQEKAIPQIIAGGNVLLISPTGVGKTEAALLPVLHNFLKEPSPGIGVIYITPLRALNRDMIERMKYWAAKTGVTCGVRHGDTPQSERSRQLRNPPQILVTTPETINLLLCAPKMSAHLENVRYVVIDEVHELAESKRGAQLALALERLRAKSGEFQSVGLSATVGNAPLVADFFRLDSAIEAGMERKMELSVELPKYSKTDVELSNLLHSSPDVVARLRRLKELIERHRSVLMFVNTRSTAEMLSSRFEAWEGENKVSVHHSSLSKDVRVVAEKSFKNGSVKGLIATSSLELGIDIGLIDLVVQYSSPRQANRLIQRVGRSGHDIARFPRGIIIANDAEDALESAVIAKNASERVLEEPKFFEKPLDVLAHQLAGIALERGSCDKLSVFGLVRKAYPYRNLELHEFEAVLRQLSGEGIIWFEGEAFGKRRKTRLYYYFGVSMIPDEARYFVKDVASDKNVGMLDESFVVNNLNPGSLFITRGKPWRVADITEREVLVEPAYDISGAIPAWEGENIPVSFESAQEVGRLMRSIASDRADLSRFFLNSDAADAVEKHVKDQKSFFIPSDDAVFIESLGNFVIVYACFGSKTNETLGKLLSVLMSSYLGETVAMKSDPYRIIFEFSGGPHPDLVEKFIRETDASQVRGVLEQSLLRTHLFRSKFMHVAKRFGLFERSRDYKGVSISRVVEAVIDSPVYSEVLNEIFTEKLDVEKAKLVLSKVKSGKIKITEYKGEASPFAKHVMSRVVRLPELVLPQRPESEIIDIMVQQANARTAKLFCTYCSSMFYSKIEDLPEKIKCASCGSPMVAFVKGKEDAKGLFSKKKLSPEEKGKKQELERSAALVSAYGKRAVIALSGRGIGAETAARVLGMRRRTEREMFKDMLEAQKAFLKTKRYWK